ncbi:sugar phosphate isomerase/epimerase family protein [Streptomyces sp. NRAIS4]
MKIGLNPYMFRTVAELGYEYIGLSPRANFMPFVLHPWANDTRVTELKNSLRTHGVQLSSVLPLYKWSSPDEEEGQVAVRYWKRVIEITVDLEYPLMNSEFNARSEPLPLFEREGIAGMMRYAGDKLKHVHIADTFNHKGSSRLRYNLNPPDTPARIHQRLDIGQGEIDWDAFFGTLRELKFDGVATACVFAWEERARESSAFMLERIAKEPAAR